MVLETVQKKLKDLNLPFQVRCTDSQELLKSEWGSSCRLLVMPGGRDLPYCKELNGKGNQNIKKFVDGGGSYLGICAGAYYGSAYVEFDKDDPNMAVVGPRELAFFPITAVGPAFPGFSYITNAGAHVAGVMVTEPGQKILGKEVSLTSLFYDGGCYFKNRKKADGEDVPDDDVLSRITLTSYTGHSEPRLSNMQIDVSGCAAIVGGRVGQGKVVLTGLHFEASPSTLVDNYEDDGYVQPLLPFLKTFEPQRDIVFKNCLQYLLKEQD